MKHLTKLLPIIFSSTSRLDRRCRLTPLGVHSSWFRINFRSAVLEFFSLPPQSVLDRSVCAGLCKAGRYGHQDTWLLRGSVPGADDFANAGVKYARLLSRCEL